MADLDAYRNEVLGRSASIIQRRVRTYLTRKSFILLQNSAVQIQTICRGLLACQHYEYLRRQVAAVRIQTHVRMHSARKAYNGKVSASILVQTGLRGMAARNELIFKRKERAATIIQRHWRGFIGRLHYLRIKKAAITTQCAWRRRVAKRELQKLKMVAKEAGALHAAKEKLEKQVEELTLSLKLERRMRVDMEEAKTKENAKLQFAMEEIQLQFKETKAMLLKEREAARNASDEPPSIQDVPVTCTDTTSTEKLSAKNEKLKDFPVTCTDANSMEKLTVENENLKALVSSLEKKIDEVEKKYEDSNRVSEDRLKKALEAESKMVEMSNEMRRLKEKLYIIQSEDEILRQQVMSCASSRNVSPRLPSGRLSVPGTPTKHNLENGHYNSEEAKDAQSSNSAVKNFGKCDSKLRRSIVERLNENYDFLINCIVNDIGFSQGKPVAVVTIYKCLLHWKSFEADRTSIFDRLVQVFGSAIEKEESSNHLAYWLSTISSLLFLMQHSLIASGAAAGISRHKPPTPPTSLFGRMTQGFRSSSASLSVDGLDFVKRVEAKYPALLFKEQLIAYLEKIYGIIRDNMKRDLTPLLFQCMQASETTSINDVIKPEDASMNLNNCNPWENVVEKLSNLLKTLRENYLPPLLIQKMFGQIFSFINVQLFNSLLQHRECCSFANGEYVKSGLEVLELWCGQITAEFVGSSWDELKHIRQAVGFLVIFQKQRISYDEIVNDLCPVLNVKQLHRICTQYWDDQYDTQSVSEDVFSSMKELMAENDTDSNSSLLNDNPCLPFSVEDLSNSLHEKDFSGVQPAEQLLDNQAFQFLKE